MTTDAKISPAFEPFLANSNPNDKRDAIVIFRAPSTKEPQVRGRLRSLKRRLDHVKARAQAQQPVQAKLLENYQKAGSARLRGDERLAVSAIGNTALPVASVRRTGR